MVEISAPQRTIYLVGLTGGGDGGGREVGIKGKKTNFGVRRRYCDVNTRTSEFQRTA